MRSLFATEEEKRDRGMRLAADKRADLLGCARIIARTLAQFGAEITVDDVRGQMELTGGEFISGNWMGSIFKGKEWERVGYKKSTHEGSHARMIMVWRLKR